MDAAIIILLVCFILLLVMDVPVAFVIGVSTWAGLTALGHAKPGFSVAHQTVAGIDSFTLLAIPFFILAGVLLGEGGMARRLIDLAQVLVGRLRGGLAYVNTVTCMLFGSISGSAAAAVSSVGSALIPEMTRHGYRRPFSVAVTTTASTTGLIIPPSNIMIVYAVIAGPSVPAMFMAGILPGIFMGLCLLLVCLLASFIAPAAAGAGAGGAVSGPGWRELLRAFRRAVLSLLLIVIVLGGIFAGIFTATEASAVAAAYALVLAMGLYRKVKVADLPRILVRAAVTTSVVMMLIGTSRALSWLLAHEQIPQGVSEALLALSDNPLVLLLIINVTLLAVGTVMDMTPAVLIFTPIFLPVAVGMGVDPVHFGIIMVANLCIGLCTPPVGTCLFVGCGVGRVRIAEVVRPMIPFFLAMVAALGAITYWPWLSLALPRAAGLL